MAWAVGYAARGYYSSAIEGLRVMQAENVPSPAYIYDLHVSRQKARGCDIGMQFSEAFKILERGSVSLAQMPYNLNYCPAPSAATIRLANRFRVRSWKHVNPRSLDTIKGELANGHPVVFESAR